ncbi:MAG TPA: hypothetical protein VMI56_15590 [Reyranella sp.]|nr:hypothetical protein [Reyranella sp.]
MTERPLTVAITGMNARADNPGPGVAVARCLAEAGRPVKLIGLAYDALDPGLYLDGLFAATYMLPYPSHGEAAFLERLTAAHRDHPIDALIPCLDAEIPACISLADRLRAMGIRTFLPSAEQFALRGKDRLADAAEQAGVEMPETRIVGSPTFFRTCTQDGWTYPLVVKGCFYDAAVVHDATQAVMAYHRIAAQWGHPVLAQKHVAGEEFNLCAIGDGLGGMLGTVMMKKRALTEKGKGWAGVCVDDPAIETAAAKLIAALKWRGPCEIEGVRTRTGEFHLLEINPRFPAWVYFTHGVGRNLPAALLELIEGRPPPAFAPARIGTLFIRYAQEVIVPMQAFEHIVTGGGRAAPEKAVA